MARSTSSEQRSLPVKPRMCGWKAGLRYALAFLVGDYQLFRIYRYDLGDLPDVDQSEFLARGYEFHEITGQELETAAESDMRARAHYSGDGAIGFAVRRNGEILCVQWYWFSDRYRSRNFWPLQTDQAKSVELFTVVRERGKGLATALKLYSAQCMKEKGFSTLFSRIWHSHDESCRVSEKAGWRYIALVAEFKPFGLPWSVRYVHRKSPSREVDWSSASVMYRKKGRPGRPPSGK